MPALVLCVAPGLLREPRGLGALPGAFLAGQPLLLGFGQGAGASPPRRDCLVQAAADAGGRGSSRSARGAPGSGTAPPERGGPSCAPGLPLSSLPEPIRTERSPVPRRGGRGIGWDSLGGGSRPSYLPFPSGKVPVGKDGAQVSPGALPSAALPRLPRIAGFPELSQQTAVPHGYPPPAAVAERPGDALRRGRSSHEEPAGGAAELCEQGGPGYAPSFLPRSECPSGWQKVWKQVLSGS